MIDTNQKDRFSETFRRLASENSAALVTFVTAGDPFPSASGTAELVVSLSRAGADIIELGIPYSDPQADGPTVQASSQRALESGATPPLALDAVRRARKSIETPIVLMTYYNPVLRCGLRQFAQAASSAGADGVILTDLPPEEAAPWLAEAEAAGLATIFLLAPTSTNDRIAAVAAKMNCGFVYCVSRTGVTGARNDVPAQLSELIARIRSATHLPVCVGFGIGTPEQVRAIAQVADGAVIGSALVDFLHSRAADPGYAQELQRMVGDWKSATRHVTRP